MLYGLPSVSNLFSICGLFFSTEDTDKHGFLFRVFCVFCGFLFHTDSHGWMSASERGGYCLSSELKRNLDGGSLAVQRLNSFDYLSADVRQMLYGFSSVSNLFNICGLYWSASGRGCGQELP